MSNLSIQNQNRPQRTQAMEWSPGRVMRELLGWDPFREMEPFFVAEERTFMPRFDVTENKDGFSFKADMPGIKDQDVSISITGNRLSITGKRESKQEQQGTTYYVCERSHGSFSRTFTLPESADTEHMNAQLHEGVLSITIPKKSGAQTRQIPVQTPPAAAKQS